MMLLLQSLNCLKWTHDVALDVVAILSCITVQLCFDDDIHWSVSLFGNVTAMHINCYTSGMLTVISLICNIVIHTCYIKKLVYMSNIIYGN